MNKDMMEHLSCLMDGEINRETGRFLIRRLGADGELRETWARYHLIRDCLRHQDGDLAGSGLSGSVRDALAGEEPRKAVHRTQPGWLKPVAGIAIAASVALFAVLAVSPGQQARSAAPGAIAEAPQAGGFTSPNILSRGPASQQANLSGGNASAANRKMNSYLLRHYQVAGSAGGKGFVSFMPIVVTQAVSQQEVEEPATDTDSKPREEETTRRQ